MENNETAPSATAGAQALCYGLLTFMNEAMANNIDVVDGVVGDRRFEETVERLVESALDTHECQPNESIVMDIVNDQLDLYNHSDVISAIVTDTFDIEDYSDTIIDIVEGQANLLSNFDISDYADEIKELIQSQLENDATADRDFAELAERVAKLEAFIGTLAAAVTAVIDFAKDGGK